MVIFSFERIISLNKKSGGDGAVDTPVPISNTEVKHFSADNSVSEDRTLLIFFLCLKFYIYFLKEPPD